MNRYLLSLALVWTGIAASFAAPLTPGQALRRAVGNGPMKLASVNASSLKLAHTVTAQSGTPALYVFDRASKNGYIIVSADDVAAPVVGYADSGSFSMDEMPPQMEWWLSGYASQIANTSSTGPYATRAPERPAIAPLMKTIWNQGTPFNNLCPTVGTQRCPTGCVATAMAQVMKYWNYPESGKGRVTCSAGWLRLDGIKFEWDKMLDSYNGDYTKDQANAVATLMQAAGYACNMSYSPNGSGALSINAAKCLSANFKYNPNIQYLQRSYFNATTWADVIYAEIAAGRPILYGGQSTSVGHEFVCDGYDGNGYFHFNWGWGGMSDGYFLLDALNPDAVGTGGGEGGGFNSGQDIIIGIQPETAPSTPRVTQFGSLTATVTGSRLSLVVNNNGATGHWLNAGITAINVYIGAEFSPLSGNGSPQYVAFTQAEIEAITLNGNSISFKGMSGTGALTIPASLPDGKYKVTVCSSDASVPDSPWIPVCATQGAYNFVYLTKTGSSYKVENFKEEGLTIVSAAPTTPVYYGKPCKIKLSLTNNSELETTGGFFPVLFEGDKEYASGEGIVVTLAPHESKEVELITVFEVLEGGAAPVRSKDYTLRFLNNPNYTDYYNWSGTITMGILSGSPSLMISDYCVTGAETREVKVTEDKTVTSFIATNPEAIPFSAKITNTGEFFASQIYTLIFNGLLTGNNLTYVAMGPTPILSRGESEEIRGSLFFPEGETNGTYAAVMFTVGSKGLEQIMTCPILYFTIEPSSGVNEIVSDGEIVIAYDRATGHMIANGQIETLDIFDIAGNKIASACGDGYGQISIPMDKKTSGIVIAVARTAAGKTVTRKIIL